MTNIKVMSDMKSRLRVDVTEWHTTAKTSLQSSVMPNSFYFTAEMTPEVNGGGTQE